MMGSALCAVTIGLLATLDTNLNISRLLLRFDHLMEELRKYHFLHARNFQSMTAFGWNS